MGSTRIFGAAALGCAMLGVVACSTSTSTAAPAAATPLITAAPSTAAQSTAAPSPVSSATEAAPSASASVTQAATDTYIAPGQSLSGGPLYQPRCAQGCQLSGDATAYLYTMTWSSWTIGSAVGSGTYKLDSCDPNCAAGTVYPVPVVATFSKPVKACSGNVTRWYWTRASFTFPKGLPKALRGASAPLNPWDFATLAQTAQESCS